MLLAKTASTLESQLVILLSLAVVELVFIAIYGVVKRTLKSLQHFQQLNMAILLISVISIILLLFKFNQFGLQSFMQVVSIAFLCVLNSVVIYWVSFRESESLLRHMDRHFSELISDKLAIIVLMSLII